MDTRGLAVAIDYLNSFHPIKLVPDELHKRAGCTCKVDTLSRKLRDNTNRQEPEKGRVIVFYDLDKRGDKVAFYGGNPGFKFEDRNKKPKRVNIPAVFFFETLEKPGVFSPYYTSREVMAQVTLEKGLEAVYFTGSHEKPVRLL
jgi:hypothetical protein